MITSTLELFRKCNYLEKLTPELVRKKQFSTLTLKQSRHTYRYTLRKIYPKVLSLLDNVFLIQKSCIVRVKVIDAFHQHSNYKLQNRARISVNCKGRFRFASVRDKSQKEGGILQERLEYYFQCRLAAILPESHSSLSVGCCDTCWQKQAD